MTTDNNPTIKQVLKLVAFSKNIDGEWRIHSVLEDIAFDVLGDIRGSVYGNIHQDVTGEVLGKINGRNWQSIESPMEKLGRLIKENGDAEMLETFNQLKDN